MRPAVGSTYDPGGNTLGTTLGAPEEAGITGTLNWAPGAKAGALTDGAMDGAGVAHPGATGGDYTGPKGETANVGVAARPGGA